VAGARAAAGAIIDRCNLTILSEPGSRIWRSPGEQRGQVTGPACYFFGGEMSTASAVTACFERSIAGLRTLNAAGLRRRRSGLR